MNTATLYKAHAYVTAHRHAAESANYLDKAIEDLIQAEDKINFVLERCKLDKDVYFKRLQAVLVRQACSTRTLVSIDLNSLPDDDLDAITLIAKHYQCPLTVQFFHNLSQSTKPTTAP